MAIKNIFKGICDKMAENADVIKQFCKTATNLYEKGWDERNGGNMSMLLDKDEISDYIDIDKCDRELELGFCAPELAGKIFMCTGTGKYFRNMEEDPQANTGIFRVSDDGKHARVLWGLSDGGRFTSELPSHLMTHAARLAVDPGHRVVIHTHPTNLIAMTFVHDLDEKKFTHTLWQMCTECIIVFPEGVGVLPWMLCGNNEIGEATAKKMQDHRIVIWSMHGVYGAGKNLDEAFGLIETVEKAAQIYMKICGLPIKNIITDEELFQLAKSFRVDYREDFLDLPSLERQGKLKDDITLSSD